MIQIRLLGVPEVTVDDQLLEELHCAPTLLQLFCFLLTYRQRVHLRSDLASLLWPENEASQSAQRLSNVLWRLGKALGKAGTLLYIDRSSVRVNLPSDDWLDVEEFDRLTASLASGMEIEDVDFASLEQARPPIAVTICMESRQIGCGRNANFGRHVFCGF